MKALLFDFSRTLLFSKNPHDSRALNEQYQTLGKPTAEIFNHFELNQELLDYLHQIKDTIALYIFTSGTMIDTAPELQSQLGDFRKIYSGTEMGLDKEDPAAYTTIAAEIGLPPEEILFVDDMQGNVDAAAKAGMDTILFESNEAVMRKTKTEI